MGRGLVLLVGLLVVGCAASEPEAPPEGLGTPLNEEVDEVSKVRDEVLD
jgi:hypothetical protein